MTYGCYNRQPYAERYFVQDGWWLDGQSRVARITQVPHRMAMDCRYTHTDLGRKDPGCDGCKHRRDGLDKDAPV